MHTDKQFWNNEYNYYSNMNDKVTATSESNRIMTRDSLYRSLYPGSVGPIPGKMTARRSGLP